VENSVKKLENEYKDALQFVDQPLATVTVGKYETTVGEQAGNLQDLLGKLQDVLKKAVENEDFNN
ncbi:type I-E CRISPR-associated protein Cas7/Cse4/CasC, partial [Lactobacillus delbrueckii subsp. bulgaricus]|nr:type I-E CRISPR-associated protein Cas7/Cse4/CasC [Lactobacillus delbrueckii subsp. bulgaricus]